MATAQEELAGFDAGTATNEGVSALFETVAQTLRQSQPEPPARPEGESGPPPMLQAMGGLMPMFTWGLNTEENGETESSMAESTSSSASGEAASAMTAGDMKAIIAELQA
ncbi:hypothetical protein ACFFSY_12490 [Paenibacillus aurantiacus]|uniref:Uncharacterized protein n=1 Tax=Paenibacillus aurantiacus TaxID=1936118 RepID=A0ABV5KND8_9BACL